MTFGGIFYTHPTLAWIGCDQKFWSFGWQLIFFALKYFFIFFQSLECNQGVDQLGVEIEIWLTHLHFFLLFFRLLHYNQGVGLIVTKNFNRSDGDRNLIYTFPPYLFFFDWCTMTKVWIGCDWKFWLFEWWPKFNWHFSTLNFFSVVTLWLRCGLITIENLGCSCGNWNLINIIPPSIFFNH